MRLKLVVIAFRAGQGGGGEGRSWWVLVGEREYRMRRRNEKNKREREGQREEIERERNWKIDIKIDVCWILRRRERMEREWEREWEDEGLVYWFLATNNAESGNTILDAKGRRWHSRNGIWPHHSTYLQESANNNKTRVAKLPKFGSKAPKRMDVNGAFHHAAERRRQRWCSKIDVPKKMENW